MYKHYNILIIMLIVFFILLIIDFVNSPQKQITAKIAISLINIYQEYISPKIQFIQCKHTITCSEFMKLKIREKGFLKGGWIGFKRVSTCF